MANGAGAPGERVLPADETQGHVAPGKVGAVVADILGAYGSDVVVHRVAPATEAVTAPLPEGLDPRLPPALGALGIERLYVHQREAYDLVSAGKDVVVVRPTASGKTLCFNLPVVAVP